MGTVGLQARVARLMRNARSGIALAALAATLVVLQPAVAAVPSTASGLAHLRADIRAAVNAQRHHKRLSRSGYERIRAIARELEARLKKGPSPCRASLTAAQRLASERGKPARLKADLRGAQSGLSNCPKVLLGTEPTKTPPLDGPPNNPPQAIVEAFVRTQHSSGLSFNGGPIGTSDFTDTMLGDGMLVPSNPENPSESNPTECALATQDDNPKPPAGAVAVCDTALETQYTEQQSYPSPCEDQTYQVTFAAVQQGTLPFGWVPAVATVTFYLDGFDNVISATIGGLSQNVVIGWDQPEPGGIDDCGMTENGPESPKILKKPVSASALNSGQPITMSFDQTVSGAEDSLGYTTTWHSTISFRWVKDPPPQQPPS
ncbi:MAG TPA: hypothetical protein VN880_02185 [Solirubrobacteraceae bacterium]|jgi:hypothetical protein|nr:hypothetical protein [Solirubrobacteraceae bacterium]